MDEGPPESTEQYETFEFVMAGMALLGGDAYKDVPQRSRSIEALASVKPVNSRGRVRDAEAIESKATS